MRKIKKILAVGLLMLGMVLLAGWGKKAVELLNDTPLIDLSKAIKEAPIGSPGNTLALDESKKDYDHGAGKGQKENTADSASLAVQEKGKRQYRIKIKDETITYQNHVCSADDLKDKIISDCSDGEASIYLEDNYAEAHVYRDVLAMLEQLKETIGLEYRAE